MGGGRREGLGWMGWEDGERNIGLDRMGGSRKDEKMR